MDEALQRSGSGNFAGTAQDALRDQFMSLWDWRRQVSQIYAQVRAEASPEQAWKFWCEARAALFDAHPQSPLSETGLLPAYFGYDPAFRFEAVLRPAAADAQPHFLPAGKDGSVRLIPFAVTSNLAPALGGELTLFWIDGYGGGVFLPFLDATSAQATYDGGRYLLDTIKSSDLGTTPDGRTILDFNFAYNPSCAYSDVWVCPLAPAVNRLPTPVMAGETTPRFADRHDHRKF